jgi:hypothetical protein
VIGASSRLGIGARLRVEPDVMNGDASIDVDVQLV